MLSLTESGYLRKVIVSACRINEAHVHHVSLLVVRNKRKMANVESYNKMDLSYLS